jgi:hypothetical protein
MQIPDEIRLGTELLGLFVMAGGILWRVGGVATNLGKMSEQFLQQGKRIDKMEAAIEKLEEVLHLVAVQKDQIQSIRETIGLNTKRTDETFSRVFAILDRLGKS